MLHIVVKIQTFSKKTTICLLSETNGSFVVHKLRQEVALLNMAKKVLLPETKLVFFDAQPTKPKYGWNSQGGALGEKV